MNVIVKLLIFSILISCATPPKPADPKVVYETDYNFAFKLPFDIIWYRAKAPHYLFGEKPAEDGSSAMIEERHGVIYPIDGVLKVQRAILKKMFEPSLKYHDPEDRVTILKTEIDYRTFKNTECLFFKQRGIDTTSNMDLKYNGMICLLPNNGNKYVWMAVSQRIRQGGTFRDLSKHENEYFDSLTFH